MRFSDVRRVEARPENVWDCLHDREVLAAVIPGCERLIPLGDGEYVAILTVRDETHRGLLTITDLRPGSELAAKIESRGRHHTLEVWLHVILQDGAGAETALVYDARVHIGGPTRPGRAPLAAAGHAVSRFFAGLDRVIPVAEPVT